MSAPTFFCIYLTEPLDVYSEWIDACEEANDDQAINRKKQNDSDSSDDDPNNDSSDSEGGGGGRSVSTMS